MTRLNEWIRTHADDPRAMTPTAIDTINARRAFSMEYGQRHATSIMEQVNERQASNTRRARDVAVAFAALKDRLASDPLFSARDAARAAEVLRSEYSRLTDELPRLAVQVERARAIQEDPAEHAERYFERFPILADRLPPLPPF